MTTPRPYHDVQTIRDIPARSGPPIPRGEIGTVARVLASGYALVRFARRTAVVAVDAIECICPECGEALGSHPCGCCNTVSYPATIDSADIPPVEPPPHDEPTREIPVDAWCQRVSIPHGPLWLIEADLTDNSARGKRAKYKKRP